MKVEIDGVIKYLDADEYSDGSDLDNETNSINDGITTK